MPGNDPGFDGGYELAFTLEGLPRLQTNNYGHWAKRSKDTKMWHQRVREAVGDKAPRKPLKRAILHFVRHSTTEPDFDNLVISFKFITDGLIRAGVILDDKPSVIGSPLYEWEFAPRGEGRVTIEVWYPPIMFGEREGLNTPEG